MECVIMQGMRTLFHPNRQDIRLTAILYALSDPIRLQIVTNLARDGELNCSGFGIEMPKSSFSHHIKVLRESGVIQTRIEGTQRFVSIRFDDLDARFPGLLQAVLQASEPF